MNSHKARYPEQYTHPLVGKRVAVMIDGKERGQSTVERVFSTRFGMLAWLQPKIDGGDAWRVSDCLPI